MGLAFVFPLALSLFVLLIPLWWGTLVLPRRLPPTRFWASLIGRTLIICALICALAGAQIVHYVDRLTTIFLLDQSDSISPSARQQANIFIQNALLAMQPHDQAALVVFGANALVEQVPGEHTTLHEVNSIPIAERTNIQDAIQLGLALLPANSEQRLVLLSDGGENVGNARVAAELAAARGSQISYVDLSQPTNEPEALLSSLVAPSNVHIGEHFDLTATIEGNVAQIVQLQFLADTQLLQTRTVQLQPGLNSFTLPMVAAGTGFHRYQMQIIPQLDTRTQNNTAAALVHVAGEPHVLIVEGQPSEGKNFQAALSAAHIQSTVIAPGELPNDLPGLSNYDSIVLINVPAASLPVIAAANLPVFVHDLGRGLVMVGGEHTYGLGGYSGTPIEQALPVYMDVRNQEERPDLALVFVIDKSGSMDACHCDDPNSRNRRQIDTGPRKVDIAKEAMIQASSVLRANDTIGVVAFDNSAHWVLPTQSRGDNNDIVRTAVTPIQPDGSSNVAAGLAAAEEALAHVDARIKHIILLTDGWSGGGDQIDRAQHMRNHGITLSVVAAGNGSAEYLAQLADAGGGRFYPSQDMQDVPHIFVQEIITTAGNYVIETPFTPKYINSSPILNQLDHGVPQLYGYNGTTLKQSAVPILAGIDNAPILAQWQYGLGRAVAWTSDFKGKWATEWITWPEFPRFAAQLIGWTLPSDDGTGIQASIQAVGAQSIITVQISRPNATLPNELQLHATIIGENEFSQTLPLEEVAPGEYKASMLSPTQGSYIVQIAGSQAGQPVFQATAGMIVPYSAEYRINQHDSELLAMLAHTTGGVALTQPANAFTHDLATVSNAQEISLPLLLFALLVLPLDIGIRRLYLQQSDFYPLRAWFIRSARHTQRRTPEFDTPLARLRIAKTRANQRTRGRNK